MERRGLAASTLVILLALGVPTGHDAAAAQTPAQPDANRPASECPVSDDPDYGYTKEQPVQVGGGAMFVASRERRYLDALRGPAGEPLRYKRMGTTTLAPHALSVIDVYEVTYDGAEKPLTMYLDAYHYDDGLRAPQGLICGAPIALTPPGPDLFQASRYLQMLAVEQGASRDFAPIPLDTTAGGDANQRRGVVLDHFRMMARVARTAAGTGKPIVLDPAIRPPDALRLRTVVVAHPLSCEGRTIAPQAIELLSPQGQPAPRQGDHASGAALTALVPDLDVPTGSVAATFGLQGPRPNDSVKITYAEACQGSAEITLPLKQTPVRPLSTPEPVLPEGVNVTSRSIRVQAQVDLDGALQHVTYVGGPRDLLKHAIQAIRTWTVDPARINNAPISTPVVLQVTFLPRPE
jgi:hypothetical protein